MTQHVKPDCPHLTARILAHSDTRADTGKAKLSWVKSIWYIGNLFIWVSVGSLYFSWGAIGIFFLTSIITLCGGHSLGMHRLFIHQSYECPKWLYYFGVWLGTIVGLGGPLTMMRTHDLRDWAQRQETCHAFPAQSEKMWTDFYWQVFCRWDNPQGPDYQYPDHAKNDSAIQFMQRTAFVQQLPLALLLFLWGGWGFVAWGICARVIISITGHWAVGWFAHNESAHTPVTFIQDGAAVQGRNVPLTALVTFGEAWHSNHHAFPWSARIGLKPNEWDPGWWVLIALQRLGLVWNIKAITPAIQKDIPCST
jgi:stearoyl-CoA desaturase (delta-9 desaturase)